MIKSNNDIINLISTYHNINQNIFILDRVYKHNYFILKNIDISKIKLSEWYIDSYKVEKYMSLILNSKNQMPIPVVSKNLSIIDGVHRLNSLFV